MTVGRLIRRLVPGSPTATRLFCFPYAGGGVSAFGDWDSDCDSGSADVEIWAIQLPGREDRLADRPVERLDHALDVLVPAMIQYLDRPFAFFGHSMGALLCWELARSLQAMEMTAPEHVFVSGYPAPHSVGEPRPPAHELSDAALLDELGRLGATPASVIGNTELMRLYLPVVRADFRIVNTYDYRPGRPLSCAVSAFGGTDDPEVTPADLHGWGELTRGGFTVRTFPGDHFYLHTQRDAVLSEISALLRTPAGKGHDA